MTTTPTIAYIQPTQEENQQQENLKATKPQNDAWNSMNWTNQQANYFYKQDAAWQKLLTDAWFKAPTIQTKIATLIPNATKVTPSVPSTITPSTDTTISTNNNTPPVITPTITPQLWTTPLTQVDITKFNPSTVKFGTDFTWDVNERNKQLASYYSQKGITDKTAIYNDLNNQQWFKNASEADKQNTARLLAQAATDNKSSVWTNWNDEATSQAAAYAAFIKDMGIVDATMANQLKLTLQNTITAWAQAQASADQYSNFNDIYNTNQIAVKEFANLRKSIVDAWWDGSQPVTDAEINQIAQKTWLSADNVKASLNGTIWQQLTPISWKEWTTTSHDRFVEDQNTTLTRAQEDLTTQLSKITEWINWQIEDVRKAAIRNIQQTSVAWALSGANQSNGFTQWLQNLQDDANKTVSRLNTQLWEAQAADLKDRGRLLDDFNKNVTRAKTDYDNAMTTIKTNAWVWVINIQNQYALGSDQMTLALQEFKQSVDLSRGQVLSNYMTNFKAAIDNTYENTNQLLQVQQKQADVQRTQQDNLFVNNGAALLSTTIPQLQEQVKNWTITQWTYTNAVNYMTSLATSTLTNMWNPTSADIQQVSDAIKNWASPQEAITKLTSANPDRFKNMTFAQAEANLQNTQAYANLRNYQAGNSTDNAANVVYSATSIADGTQLWTTRGQCVAFVNDILETNWLPAFSHDADQSLKNKISKINSQTPAIGDVLVRTSPLNPANGDVVFVTWIAADGTISYKWSNKTWAWEVYSGTINKNDASIQGYYDPTKAPSTYQQLSADKKLAVDDAYSQIYGKKSKINPEFQNNIAVQVAKWDTLAQIVSSTQGTAMSSTQMTEDYSSNKKWSTGAWLSSVDTAMKHMTEYKEAIKTYNSSWLPALNKLAIKLGYQAGTSAQQVLWQITNTLANEMSNVYWDNTDAWVESRRANIPKESSVSVANSWLDTAHNLIEARIDSANSKRRDTMGNDYATCTRLAKKYWFILTKWDEVAWTNDWSGSVDNSAASQWHSR